MVYLMVIIIVHIVNYIQNVHFADGNRRPTSAARTEVHSMLFCQSLNKPGCVHGLPSSAARNDLTQPRTSSRYGLRLRTLPWGYLPVKYLTAVNITHILLWYISSLRVVSSTLRLVRIISKHNISSWVTLHSNTISSLFLHIIIRKVLMPPYIHFHIDPVSILVVIEHITLHRYFQLHMYRLVLISHLHSLRSEARLTSSLIGRWGRPCGARTSDHAIAPATDHATHCGPYAMGG